MTTAQEQAINFEYLNLTKLLAASSPAMTKAKFAEISGLDIGVITSMIYNGHLPSIKIGRHRMVNIAALLLQCMNKDSE